MFCHNSKSIITRSRSKPVWCLNLYVDFCPQSFSKAACVNIMCVWHHCKHKLIKSESIRERKQIFLWTFLESTCFISTSAGSWFKHSIFMHFFAPLHFMQKKKSAQPTRHKYRMLVHVFRHLRKYVLSKYSANLSLLVLVLQCGDV